MLNTLLLSLTNHACRAIPLAMAAALAAMATAQNLVPNPSFEDTVNCSVPTQCTLLKAQHWFSPTLSSPDLFDQDTARLCGYAIPGEGTGYLPPKAGFRMAGEYFWDGPFGGPAREYMMTPLIEDLTQGAEYQISLWYARNPGFQAAVDHIGVWLGPDSAFETTIGPMNLVPQVKLRDPTSTYLANGNEWTQLVDTLTAEGGERWLIIGNFDPQDSIDGIVADPSAPYSNCYYYIDDVAVRAIDVAGVPEIELPTISWNGLNMVLRSDRFQGPVVIDVLDATGRLLHRSTLVFTDGRSEAPMAQYPNGLYLMRISGSREEAVIRFVKGDG